MKHSTLFSRLKAAFLIVLVIENLCCCAPLVVAAVAGAGGGAVASANTSKSEHHSTGTYIATVLSNVPYFPAKIIFAGLGAVTSGVTYLVTGANPEPTRQIWNAAVNGDYLIKPAMMEGSEPIHFVGK